MDQDPQPTRLTGAQRQALLQVLLDAFPRQADLERTLDHHLDLSLAAISPAAGTYQDVLFSLIGWFQAQNRIADLIDAARTANPSNRALAHWKQQVPVKTTQPSASSKQTPSFPAGQIIHGNEGAISQYGDATVIHKHHHKKWKE